MAAAMEAAAETTAMEPASTPTMAIATEPKAEGDAGTVVIGVIGIATVTVIGVWRRVIGIGRRRRAIARRRHVISRLAVILVHAGIIGIAIGSLNIARRMARIVGADRSTGNQTSARAGRGAQTGIAGGRAQNRAECGAAKRATHGAAGLFVPRGFARRGVAGTRGRITAAEDIAIGLSLLDLLLGRLRGCAGLRRR